MMYIKVASKIHSVGEKQKDTLCVRRCKKDFPVGPLKQKAGIFWVMSRPTWHDKTPPYSCQTDVFFNSLHFKQAKYCGK